MPAGYDIGISVYVYVVASQEWLWRHWVRRRIHAARRILYDQSRCSFLNAWENTQVVLDSKRLSPVYADVTALLEVRQSIFNWSQKHFRQPLITMLQQHFLSFQFSYGPWATTTGTSNRACISLPTVRSKWWQCTGTWNMHTVYMLCVTVGDTCSTHGAGPPTIVLFWMLLIMPTQQWLMEVSPKHTNKAFGMTFLRKHVFSFCVTPTSLCDELNLFCDNALIYLKLQFKCRMRKDLAIYHPRKTLFKHHPLFPCNITTAHARSICDTRNGQIIHGCLTLPFFIPLLLGIQHWSVGMGMYLYTHIKCSKRFFSEIGVFIQQRL